MMFRVSIVTMLALGALAGCANDKVSYGSGLGANIDGGGTVYVGMIASTSPACPAMDIHLHRMGANELDGVVFDPMHPAMMSAVKGTIAADGTVSMMVTPMGAKAPAGMLTGHTDGGALVVGMAGGACPMVDVHLMPAQMIFGNHG